MQVFDVNLISNGAASVPGYEQRLRLGYSKNKGVYQLQVNATGEWEGLTIRAIWHLPDGTSTTTLAMDGCVAVPAVVTALSGNGCITFEGATEGKTVTSADLRYTVGANSGVDGGTLPEPDTPAWEQLVGTVAESAAQAEEAADRADKAAAAAEGALTAVEGTASKALTDITHTGTAQTQAVTRAGEQAVQEVDSAAQAGVGSVGQAQQTATQAVQTAATTAIQQVEQTGGTQVQAIAAAGAAQVQAVEAAAAQKLESITQLAGQAEDSATKAEQAAQRAEDAATAASTIIDDTVITPDKTWSSKGIVDVLCPSIQATGNPVVCHPVAGYPLGVIVDFAPIQDGAGDPSPENIRPIKGRDSVAVTRCGVNLLPFGERIEDIDQQQIMASADTLLLSKACVGQKLTLTFSIETKNIAFKDDADTWKKRIGFECHGTLADGTEAWSMQCWLSESSDKLTSNGKKTKTVTVTMPDLVDGNITFYAQNIKSGNYVAYDFGIYAGTTAPTTYTPYTGQTATLTLPRTIYGGTVDAVTGEGQETWKLLTLDGTEPWADNGNIASRKEQQWALYGILGPYPGTFGISSHFDNIKGSQVYPFNFVRISANSLVFHVALDGPFATSDALKSYLAAQYAAGTPVQIAYKLATPTPITATGGKPIPALAGVNTLMADSDSLTVTGRADPTHEIQQLRAAVVALGGTI